jgi:uncharacterized protein YndB with AHSA1/START domain
MTFTMNNLHLRQAPVAETAMLIRKPVAEVFEAFVNPDITTRFWFTKSSGRLEPGKQVQWIWEMYDFSSSATVKAIEPNKRIVVEWAGHGAPTTIEWIFTAYDDNSTFVSITNVGFSGDADEIVKAAIDSAQGFSYVLAGAKALLEHNLQLNLIPDRFPKGIEEKH